MIERIVIIDKVDPVQFYGVNNANMHLLKNLFPKLRISARGSVVRVVGEESETAEFEAHIRELCDYAETVQRTARGCDYRHRKGRSSTRAQDRRRHNLQVNGKPISARTPNQAKLIETFDTPTSLSPWGGGTGKTYIAIALAVRITQEPPGAEDNPLAPCRGGGRKTRLPPGDMKDKIDPYLQPFTMPWRI